MNTTQPTSFRLSADAVEVLQELSQWLGLKRSAVIELAIRRLHTAEVAENARKTGQKKIRKKSPSPIDT